MKKFFFFAIAALGMMAGCQKQEINDVQKPVDDSDRVAVQFNIDAPSLTIAKTKGAGPVEEWANQNLYILGYQRPSVSFELAEALIPNVVAAAPASGTEDLIDVVRPAKMYDEKGDLVDDPAAGEAYYYGDGVVYDFYGYYVDDANITVEETTDNDGNVVVNKTGDTSLEAAADGKSASISLHIDGTQDVMAAKADPEADAFGSEVTNPNLAYSAYAARRDVHPTLTFNHMLTRFNFHVVAGAKSAENITVESITLDSYDDVVLTVAPEPVLALATGETAKTNFTLSGVSSDVPYTNGTYDYDYDALLESDDAKVGQSIMAVAGESAHTIYLTTKLTGSQQSITPLKIDLFASDIVSEDGEKDVTSFLAGYQYDIIIKVYGPEKVEITVKLNDWKEGGSTVYDPDKEMEEPVAATATLLARTKTTMTISVEAPETYSVVEAGLSTDATVVPTTWVPVSLTKALSGEITFTGLDETKTYYIFLRYSTKANPEDKDFTVEETTLEATTFNIEKGWLVKDEDTYMQLPESYLQRPGCSWEDYQEDLANFEAGIIDPANPFNKLPWLAFTFTPVSDLTVTVTGPGELNYTETFSKEDGTFSLLTLCEAELGKPIVAGTYIINLNGDTSTVTVQE